MRWTPLVQDTDMLSMKIMIVATMLAMAGVVSVVAYSITVSIHQVSEAPRTLPFGPAPTFDHRGTGY